MDNFSNIVQKSTKLLRKNIKFSLKIQFRHSSTENILGKNFVCAYCLCNYFKNTNYEKL